MPESEPRLIRGYLQILAAQLPGPIVEELTDGLTETYRSYRIRGLPADAAAEAAVEEFGPAEEILAGFARVNPARQAARRLLGLGPVVGGCWVAALDASLIVGTLLVAGRVSGLTVLAIAVSSARIALCARAAVASQQNT
jgi:hypothetical protein